MRKTGETHQTQLLQTFLPPRSHGVKAQGGGLNDITTHSYNWSRSFRCGYWVAIQKRKRRTERCIFVETTPSDIQKVRGDLQSCWRLSQEPSLCWCWAEETVKRSPSFHGTGCIATFPTEGFSHRVRLHQSPEPLSVKGVYSLCLGTQTILLDKDSLTNLYTLGKSDGCGFACLLPWDTYHKENILESEKTPQVPLFSWHSQSRERQ